MTGQDDECGLVSTILDNVGLSTEMVAWRILRYVAHDNIDNIAHPYIPFLTTGSQIEGVGLDDIMNSTSASSDIDKLIVLNNKLFEDTPVVVHDQGQVQHVKSDNKIHYEAMTSHGHPGFIDLHRAEPDLVVMGDPLLKTPCLQSGVFVKHTGRSFALNKYARSEWSLEIHGPAQQMSPLGRRTAVSDNVFCLHMPMWPKVANEWTTRTRYFGWPSSRLVDSVVRRGCHIVPVGHYVSPDHRSDNWRLSFSVAERTLVWSFNDVQRKCYFILKLLCKEIIGDTHPGLISSYYMKTLMFWMIEETDRRQWCTENLLYNVRWCLDRLRVWISDGNIPNYFVAKNNMIDHKLTTDIQNRVCNVLEHMQTNLWSLLKWCHKLLIKNPRAVPVSIRVDYTLAVDMLFIWQLPMCATSISTEYALAMQLSLLKAYKTLWPRVQTKYVEKFVESNVGSLYHALCQKSSTRGQPDPDLAKLAETFLTCSMNKLPGLGHLRLANFYYSQGNYSESTRIIREMEQWKSNVQLCGDSLFMHLSNLHVRMSSVQTVCDLLECYDNVESPTSRGPSHLIDEIYNRCGVEVIYTLSEIPCVDKVVVYQIVASSFDPAFPGCTLIYNAIFELYLLFGSSYRQGYLREANAYLTHLENWTNTVTISQISRIVYMDAIIKMVSHNILAYCLALVGRYRDAAHHVILSLQIKPELSNAAVHYLLTVVRFCQADDTAGDRNILASNRSGVYRFRTIDGYIAALRHNDKELDEHIFRNIFENHPTDRCDIECILEYVYPSDDRGSANIFMPGGSYRHMVLKGMVRRLRSCTGTKHHEQYADIIQKLITDGGINELYLSVMDVLPVD
jgi:hypothetical protein